jgi:hypothetical protein
MDGICALCSERKPLRDSHVLPAFVFRWLRSRSGKGHIRDTENPNLRVQDGLKFPWLCGDCESRFNSFETAFATNVFHPLQSGSQRIQYETWLLKFCVSISWRVLKFARGNNPQAQYTHEQLALMDKAATHWRAFLFDEVQHPSSFEQHLLIFDLIKQTTIKNLPNNFNRFMMGAVTLDIVGSANSLATFAKLGQFNIFGIIQKGTNRWVGTKVHVKNGLLKPGEFTAPVGLLDLFRSKAEYASRAMNQLSEAQRKKIDSTIASNLDAFARSDQFAAIKADAQLFGDDAVLWKTDD